MKDSRLHSILSGTEDGRREIRIVTILERLLGIEFSAAPSKTFDGAFRICVTVPFKAPEGNDPRRGHAVLYTGKTFLTLNCTTELVPRAARMFANDVMACANLSRDTLVLRAAIEGVDTETPDIPGEDIFSGDERPRIFCGYSAADGQSIIAAISGRRIHPAFFLPEPTPCDYTGIIFPKP